MSTDIYTFIEYREQPNDDWLLATGYDLSRSACGYDLYAALAGVRNTTNKKPLYEPRGFPEDSSLELIKIYFLQIMDGGTKPTSFHTCTTEDAINYESLPNTFRRKFGNLSLISHPDYFKPTWLTRDEIRKALIHFELAPNLCGPHMRIVQEFMHTIEKTFGPDSSRMVIWFA